MTRRTFHCVEGGCNKFWAVWGEGASLHVHFGRIGTNGQKQLKTFGSEAEAKAAAEKLIAEKTKKGYVEVSNVPTDAVTDAVAAPTAAPPVAPVAPATTPAQVVPASVSRIAASRLVHRPFDFAACKQELIRNAQRPDFLRWNEAIGPEEAFFWLVAYSVRYGRGTSYENEQALRELTPEVLRNPPTLQRVEGCLNRLNLWDMIIPLMQMQATWLTPTDFCSLLCTSPVLHYSPNGPLEIANWLERSYLPSRDASALNQVQAVLRERLGDAEVNVRLTAAILAGGAGMSEEV
ncbi:MAG: WGR domain-containing protein, partial [Gemmataceae bacterium]